MRRNLITDIIEVFLREVRYTIILNTQEGSSKQYFLFHSICMAPLLVSRIQQISGSLILVSCQINASLLLQSVKFLTDNTPSDSKVGKGFSRLITAARTGRSLIWCALCVILWCDIVHVLKSRWYFVVRGIEQDVPNPVMLLWRNANCYIIV